jgi:uncharacterized membrane protein
MNSAVSRFRKANAPKMEAMLAALLQYGSWVASTTIGIGLALVLIDSNFGTHNLALLPDMRIVTMGIALFILLPVLRVALMFVLFLRQGDYRLGMIAALVLTIILFGYALGRHMVSEAGGKG